MGEKTIDDLPSDVLAIIFEHTILMANEHQCCWCNRPYYWIIDSRQALKIKAVSRRWRLVFLHNVILRAMTQQVMPWCTVPQTCARKHWQWVADKVSVTRPSFLQLDRTDHYLRWFIPDEREVQLHLLEGEESSDDAEP